MDIQEDIKKVQRASDVVLHRVLAMEMSIDEAEQEARVQAVTEEVLDRILATEVGEMRILYKRELGEIVTIGVGVYELVKSEEWVSGGRIEPKGWMFRNQWIVLQDRAYEKHGI